MAFTNTNDWLAGRIPTKTPPGSALVSQRFTLALATADLAANAIGAVGILPAGCVPVMAIVDSDDLDTGASPALAMQIGVLNSAGTDFDVSWLTGVNCFQNAGSQTIETTPLLRTGATDADRQIGLKVTTAAATAAAGTVGVTLIYQNA